MKIYLASSNPGKLIEFQELIRRSSVRTSLLNDGEVHLDDVKTTVAEDCEVGWKPGRPLLLSLESLSLPEGVDIVEDGDSFSANVKLKVDGYARFHPGVWIMADDSGLAIDALDGRPGVYSARYAGEATSYPEKFQKLYEELRAVEPDRERWTAQFICCLAVRSPEGEVEFYHGVVEGRIIEEARGEGGFGYDPIFYLPDLGKTTAELTLDEKNHMSHRARAVEAWREAWEEKGYFDALES